MWYQDKGVLIDSVITEHSIVYWTMKHLHKVFEVRIGLTLNREKQVEVNDNTPAPVINVVISAN